MALGLIMLATAACDNRESGGSGAGRSTPATNAPAAASQKAGLAAGTGASHKISVKLKKQNGQCVVEDPGAEIVQPGDYVRWKYKNQCGAKKTEKINRKGAPISGDCDKDTDLEDGDEKEGKDCIVDPLASPGKYKYGIDGSVVLDPELDIPPPPPPQDKKAEPTPSAK